MQVSGAQGRYMKFLLGLVLALAVTIAWQASVLSEEKTDASLQQAIDQVQQENLGAGRVSFDEADCD